MGNKYVLFKPPCLWYFVIADQAKSKEAEWGGGGKAAWWGQKKTGSRKT
jgi:hypothetical protein